jgi:hypothetical protein
MSDGPYATFIADCRQERAHLAGLIEALEGIRTSPGARIEAQKMEVDFTRLLTKARRVIKNLLPSVVVCNFMNNQSIFHAILNRNIRNCADTACASVAYADAGTSSCAEGAARHRSHM